MTAEQRILAVFQAIGADIKELRSRAGSLAALTTTDKTSLVAALNELKAAIDSVSGGGASINDLAASSESTFSSTKINQLISDAIAGILGGAASAYDTLLEIQNELQGDDTAISSLLTAVSKRVAFDASQSLTEAEKLQACTNIGVGNPDRNFLSDYTTARDA